MTSTETPPGDEAVRSKIAELPAFVDLASRVHELVMEAAPELHPRLWYGMPGYARSKSGPVLVFFRVDGDDYLSFGLSEKANHELDQDAPDRLRPAAWFLTDLDDATEARLAEIITRALR